MHIASIVYLALLKKLSPRYIEEENFSVREEKQLTLAANYSTISRALRHIASVNLLSFSLDSLTSARCLLASKDT